MSDLRIDWRAVVDEAIRRRKAEGLSQRSLAALAGVSVPTVNAFEQGDVRLRLERVAAILEALGLFVSPQSVDPLQAFVQDARSRWAAHTAKLPPDHWARRPLGHYEFAAEFGGEGIHSVPLKELRAWLRAQPPVGDWRPFPTAAGARPEARNIEGGLERWVNDPGSEASDDATASDYWRIDGAGRAFVRRGFREDAPGALVVGTIFDLSLPILHFGAFLRSIASLARQAGGDEATIVRFRGRYAGLAGRALFAWANPRLRSHVPGEPQAVADSIDLAAEIPLGQIESDLAESVTEILGPLFERFQGFRLTRELASQQLGEVSRREGTSIGPFAVTKEMVIALADRPLRALLGKLLEAEASTRRIPSAGIDLGGSQTAPDGGVDAALRWTDSPEPGGWLPRRDIYFQCKAQVLAGGAIAREMRPKGHLRPIFAELVAVGGAYVIFSTDDVGAKGLEDRLGRMRAELSELPGADRIHLDFLGADRIARWVNQHPGVALWLLQQAGRALGGWRPYGSWSAEKSDETPYLLDEAPRAIIGGQQSDVRDAIGAMRGTLASGGGCVRLVGLSGMGKTRLAEALFDERIPVGRPLLPSLAIYADAGHELATSAALVAEQLVMAGTEAVLVVDNCAARTHAQLAEIVRREASRVSLLTIDYDVGEDQPGDTLIIRLEPSSESVLSALLEQRVPRLSRSEIDHLARFSEGNARVALAIARGAADEIDLSKLTDAELLDRLFQTDRGANPDTRRAANAAALVYAFYADKSNVPVEHPVLAKIVNMAPESFYGHVERLLEWGIAQQRSSQRAIKPDAIANQLAANMLKFSDLDALLTAFSQGPERLFASFARRLGQLDSLPKAQAVARLLLSDSGWLGDLRSHSEHQRRAFFHLAPAAPEMTLRAIEHVLANEDPSPLTASHNDRDRFATLLVHLAFDESLFQRAMEGLLQLALAEQGEGRTQNARDHLLQRFWPALAWTGAQTGARVEFLDRMLDDDDPAIRTLGVEAIDHMLDTMNLSSSFDPAFGSRLRTTEWRPRGPDYDEWIEAAYSRIERIAVSSDPASERARQIVAEHLRQHLHSGLAERAVAAMRKVRPAGYWDDGWRQATEALHFGRGERNLDILLPLERELRPRTLAECFEAFVLGEPWRHWHPSGREKAPTRDVQLIAKAAGARMVRSGLDLGPYLERASSASGQTSVVSFGEGLGMASPDLDALWRAVYDVFVRTSADQRNAGVIIGVVRAADKRDAMWADARLNAAVEDPLLNGFIVHLHSARALSSKDAERLIQALEKGATPDHLSALMYGGATKPVPAADLARLLDRMIAHPEGALPALEVLSMRIFGDRQDKQPIAAELVAVARTLLIDRRCYPEDRGRVDHELASLAKTVFETDAGTATAVGICRTMRGLRRDYWGARDFPDLSQILMQRHLRVVLDEIVASASDDERYGLASMFFGGLGADIDGDTAGRRVELDESIILEWIAVEPQVRAQLLARIVPYTVRSDTGELAWSSIASAIIDIAPDPRSVLSRFEGRFFSGVSSGTFASRFVRRLPMVASLKDHSDRRVRNWAREAGQRLQREIEHWDSIDRASDSQFE